MTFAGTHLADKNNSLGRCAKDEGSDENENGGAWSDDYQSDSGSDDNKDDVASMTAPSLQNQSEFAPNNSKGTSVSQVFVNNEFFRICCEIFRSEGNNI